MRWTHATVALTTLAFSTLAFFAGRWSALPSRDACHELDGIDPAIANLDQTEIERRFLAGATIPPSAAEKQIAALRARAEGTPLDRRACMKKALFARAVVTQEEIKRSTPGLWGLNHPSEEIKNRFLAEPLKNAWSREDRLDVIAQIEEQSIARLAGKNEADLEHWRRRWYGLMLACEGTDEALAHIGTTRPTECPHFAPKRPAP